jgi:hypothetical protein
LNERKVEQVLHPSFTYNQLHLQQSSISLFLKIILANGKSGPWVAG